ncbi:DUF4269 domain-containing protein [Thalassospira lucentensis]|uniref:DUF4269 domain-containing protein n=1 Tax=Thalassospira lucentensis TaxID=168935 RepID=UPI00399D5C9F
MNQTVMDWPDPLCAAAFCGLEKLQQASEVGANAALALQHADVLGLLAEFDPVIAGTLPIAINTEQSDIDILCHTVDLSRFNDCVDSAFSSYPHYRRHQRAPTKHVGVASVVRFECAGGDCRGFEVEIFATDCPSTAQYGFIHMLAEARILALLGPDFAKRVRALKRQNVKTEPAFAQLLRLSGDPYIGVAELANMSMAEMAAFVNRKWLSAAGRQDV